MTIFVLVYKCARARLHTSSLRSTRAIKCRDEIGHSYASTGPAAARRRMDAGAEARRRRARTAPAGAARAKRGALAWRRGAQGHPGCAARAQMNPEKRREIYRRLRAANPNPTTELKYRTPYELLVAVVLSAQATDKSVNQASALLFEQFDTPEKMAKLGLACLEHYIRRIGPYRT